MGSRYSSPNKAEPIWLAPLRAERPACMDAEQWELYLQGVREDAAAQPTLRRRLSRGGKPNHCIGCNEERRSRMRKQQRCFPIKVQEPADAA